MKTERSSTQQTAMAIRYGLEEREALREAKAT